MISGTVLGRECSITEHQQAVQYSIRTELSFRTESFFQDIHFSLMYIGADNGDIKFVH